MHLWGRLLSGRKMTSAAHIREFMDTKRCDRYSDLLECRRNLEMRLVPHGRLGRIIGYTETDADEKMAAQTLMYFRSWHRQRLLHCLPMHLRVRCAYTYHPSNSSLTHPDHPPSAPSMQIYHQMIGGMTYLNVQP